jgi:hypothetical protein
MEIVMTKTFDLKKYFLPLGMFSLVMAIVLNRFGGDSPVLSFVSGMGFGLSLVMHLAFLTRFGKANRRR